MFSFTRIATFAFVLLSLSFLVSAIPLASRTYGTVCRPTGTDAVSALFLRLATDIEAKINSIAGCGSKTELEIAIKALVTVFQGCAAELLKIGAGVAITVEAKASLVACICSIISLLVKVCVAVSAKFGIFAVVGLFVQIDVCLKVLLLNLNICVGGVISLIVKGLAGATIGLMGQVHLGLCLGVLGLGAGINLGIGAGTGAY